MIINSDCVWLLAQLRVDGVLMRMRDTRFFCALKDWPQKSPEVIRERSWREATFAELAAVSFRELSVDFSTKCLRKLNVGLHIGFGVKKGVLFGGTNRIHLSSFC